MKKLEKLNEKLNVHEYQKLNKLTPIPKISTSYTRYQALLHLVACKATMECLKPENNN